MKSCVTLLALVGAVAAQVPAWGQCGGSGFQGLTTCASGYSCVSVNQYYSQCQAGSPAPVSTVPSSPNTSTAPATPAPTGGSAEIRYLGRVNPSTMELSWPSTGIAFTFTGTTATIGVASVTGDNSADLIIDGGAPTVISSVTGDITTPTLSAGSHTVELRKRSEAVMGSVFLTGSVKTDGTLGTTTVPARRVEIIGDSISVGYGLDGTYPCTNTAAIEDNPKTYGALAAESFMADWSTVAWSGKGLIRNIATGSVDTSPLMPELYTRYGANDADNSYTFPAATAPQAIVIALGTNDFSYLGFNADGTTYDARQPIDPTAFTNGMVSFIKSIQTHYPDANFFLVSSPMLSDYYPTTADAQKTTQETCLKNAASQIGAKATFVSWPTQGTDVGCDYHPNAATQAAEGKVLAAAIGTALGW